MRKLYAIYVLTAAAAAVILAAYGSAQVTGDSRTVTEPSFPAVCQQVSAALTAVNNDIPAATDTPPNSTQPDTTRIQAALNACANTGQAVELSMDSTNTYDAFLSGPLVMQNNETLLVDPGVTLFFSRNVQDFDFTPGTHTCGTNNGSSNNKTCKPPIDVPKTSSNVGIMGYGKLNARGGDPLFNCFATAGYTSPSAGNCTWWAIAAEKNQQVPEAMIQPESGVTNLTVYKITLQNSSMFHIKSIGTIANFTAWDVKIETPTFTNNTDGIDPDQGTNVTIANSWISDGDDDVALGDSGPQVTSPSNAGSKNLSIINNHFFAGHGESIGSFTDGGVANVLFDNNMLAGDDFSGHGSAINATAVKINSTTYPVDYADGNSTAIRIKSDQAAGGLVANVQYSNSCFLDHKADILFTPLYNTDSGSQTPNVYNITLENLAFLNDANSWGTLQFTGTNTTVSGTTYTYPLGVTLSNVSFPDNLPTSKFTNSGSSGKEQYTNMTYGPGAVSTDFINDYATFAAVGSNFDTVTNNISGGAMLNPPTCNFTYIAPELTGPRGLPQTITYGESATAVVILTPAVSLAAYPTGTVSLTDSFNGHTTTAALPGNGDTLFVPLNGLSAGTHVFTMTYGGDSNYVAPVGQNYYSTAGPYTITVNPAPLTVVANNLTKTAGTPNPTLTVTYSGFENGDTAASLSGTPAISTTAKTSSAAGVYPISISQGTLSDSNYTFSFEDGTLTVLEAPTVTLTTTATLSKVAGGYQAVVKVTNTGTAAASNVWLTTATLGPAAGATLPASLGTIPGSGGWASVTLTFPSSAGNDGTTVAEKLAGTYTGGSFSASIRALLP